MRNVKGSSIKHSNRCDHIQNIYLDVIQLFVDDAMLTALITDNACAVEDWMAVVHRFTREQMSLGL